MFDECRWWYQQGIDYQLDVTFHSIQKISQKQPFFINLSNFPDLLYQTLLIYFEDHTPLVYTILFGSRIDMLSKDIKNYFFDSGLIHLLVVSGAQISLISMAVIKIGQLFRSYYLFLFLIFLNIQFFYLLIAGFDPSFIKDRFNYRFFNCIHYGYIYILQLLLLSF